MLAPLTLPYLQVPGATGIAAIAAGAFHNMALSHRGEVSREWRDREVLLWPCFSSVSSRLPRRAFQTHLQTHTPSKGPLLGHQRQRPAGHVIAHMGLYSILPSCSSPGPKYLLQTHVPIQVYTWGTNDYGQLGNGCTSYDTEPRKVPGLEGVVVSGSVGLRLRLAVAGWH